MPGAGRIVTRVAIAGMALEANAFAPMTTAADFRGRNWFEGEAILVDAARAAPSLPAEVPAFLEAARAKGWTPVPILITGAEPGGPVDQRFFEETVAAIVAGLLAAQPLDGVYLVQHGAMMAMRAQDADGVMFRAIREALGPKVPIVATLDLHANISEEMVAATDLLVGYRTNPHVDMAERAREAAEGLALLIAGAKLHKAFIRLPIVPPSVSLLTAQGPFADLIRAGEAARRAEPSIVNVSCLGGFAFSDTPKNGLAIIVTGRDPAVAWRIAGRLAADSWADRGRYVARLTALEDAVAAAREVSADPARAPLLLADVADNPGGGASGNTLYITQALVEAGVTGALVGTHFDPKLAEEAHERGLGARMEAFFNRGGMLHFTRRWTRPATVIALSDGACVGGADGIYAGRSITLGPCAALDLGGVVVAVASVRRQCADPVFFRQLGLDPANARVVVVKSRGHFRAGFAPLFRPDQILEVDAPGLTSPVLTNFKFKHLPRPVWPLDPDAVWNPPGR
jgi:microcystin degradation protein MlrC